MPEALKKAIQQLKAQAERLSKRARIIAVLAVVLVFGGALYLSLADRTPYSTLFSGLARDDAGRIVAALKKQHVPYRLAGGGSAVLVPSARVHEVRLAMASAGLPKGSGVGFEIFDNQKFGISDFAQRVNYRRAMQGELERTIKRLDSVQSARVHIAMEGRRLFARKQRPVSAAVTLKLHAGRVVSQGTVRAVVHLVSSSVSGLASDRVTVVDTTGNLLWGGRKKDGLFSGGSGGPLAYKSRLEETFERRVRQILAAALGAGRSVVKVSADIGFSRVVQTDERYDPDKTAVRSESSLEEKSGRKGTRNAGVPGVRGNLPGGPKPTAKNRGAQTKRKRVTRNYEVNRTIRKRVMPAGSLKRLSVAVLVDEGALDRSGGGAAGTKGKKPAAKRIDLASLEQVVRHAVGFSAQRGDVVTVRAVAFARNKALAAGPPPGLLIFVTKHWPLSLAAAVLLTLVVVAFIWWRARKRRKRREAEDAKLLPMPLTVAELEAKSQREAARAEGGAEGDAALPSKAGAPALTSGERDARQLVLAAAEHDSLRAAGVLRAWLGEVR